MTVQAKLQLTERGKQSFLQQFNNHLLMAVNFFLL